MFLLSRTAFWPWFNYRFLIKEGREGHNDLIKGAVSPDLYPPEPKLIQLGPDGHAMVFSNTQRCRTQFSFVIIVIKSKYNQTFAANPIAEILYGYRGKGKCRHFN